MLGAERLDRRLVAGDEGRRHQLGEIHHEQLLGRVAHAARIVDDQRPRLDALENVRRRDIGEIERRVLAQQHDVDGREVDELRLAEARMIALDVLDRQRLGHRLDARAVEPQSIGRVVQQAMAARLGFEKKREGRIAGDADALDRVHLHGDGQGHGRPVEGQGRFRESVDLEPIRVRRVTGKPAGRDEDGVAPQGSGPPPRVSREPDPRGARDSPPLGRADRDRRDFEIGPRFDLDEGDRAASSAR